MADVIRALRFHLYISFAGFFFILYGSVTIFAYCMERVARANKWAAIVAMLLLCGWMVWFCMHQRAQRNESVR